jgi:hypothetical protein
MPKVPNHEAPLVTQQQGIYIFHPPRQTDTGLKLHITRASSKTYKWRGETEHLTYSCVYACVYISTVLAGRDIIRAPKADMTGALLLNSQLP